MGSFIDTLKHSYSIFSNSESFYKYDNTLAVPTSYKPDRVRLTRGNERSIITAIYNRIAMDVSAISIKHVRVDSNERYFETIKSPLNKCLTLEANKDQTSRAFLQDIVMSMLDEGCIAIIPTETNDVIDKKLGIVREITSMRVGKIVEWMPDYVKVNAYDDRVGIKKDIVLPKKMVAIIENPFYSVMNEPNSILQRLIKKLNLLDVIDEQSGSGKLDMIVQLPYVIKTEARQKQAEQRRADIERQLNGSKLGIAYTDGTEKITQLNRPLENNLMKQIEYLTSMLYSQLGITEDVLSGKADEKTMLNYISHTIEPIISAITDEMKRKFLTATARTQGQSIMFFKDPFKLVPVNNIADIADKFTRNEIMSSNEIRQIVGLIPSKDPSADQLRNKNINQAAGQEFANTNDEANIEGAVNEEGTGGEIQNDE